MEYKYKVVIEGDGYSTFKYVVSARGILEAMKRAQCKHKDRGLEGDRVLSAIQWSK